MVCTHRRHQLRKVAPPVLLGERALLQHTRKELAVRRQLHKDDAVAAGDGLKAAEADDVRVLEHLEQPHFVLHGLLAHFPRIHQLCRHPLAALGVARGDDLAVAA